MAFRIHALALLPRGKRKKRKKAKCFLSLCGVGHDFGDAASFSVLWHDTWVAIHGHDDRPDKGTSGASACASFFRRSRTAGGMESNATVTFAGPWSSELIPDSNRFVKPVCGANPGPSPFNPVFFGPSFSLVVLSWKGDGSRERVRATSPDTLQSRSRDLDWIVTRSSKCGNVVPPM